MAMTANTVAYAYQGDSGGGLLANLAGGGPTILTNAPPVGVAPITGNESAYEWDPTIQPGGTFLISTDQQFNVVIAVPEPSTLSLLLWRLVWDGSLAPRGGVSVSVRSRQRDGCRLPAGTSGQNTSKLKWCPS